MSKRRTLSWDWYPGFIPENVVLAADTYIESTISFECYQSEANVGLSLGRGSSIYKDTMLDVGLNARVEIGEYSLIHGARVCCDGPLTIGNHVLISWQVVLMDSYRVPFSPKERMRYIEKRFVNQNSKDISKNRLEQNSADIRPISIGDNVWIGFDSCILPGVMLGEGSVVGARSVVTEDVLPYCVVAGNPARVIKTLVPEAV